MKRTPLRLSSAFAMLMLLIACDTRGSTPPGFDSSATDAAAADADAPDATAPDAGMLSDEADLGTSSAWPQPLDPPVELPPTVVEVDPPPDCERHEPFEIPFALPPSRFQVSAADESIWTWGPDHYLDGFVRSGRTEVRQVAAMSERIGPPRLFPLPADEGGARRLLHRNEYLVKDGEEPYAYFDTIFTPDSSRDEPRFSWVLAVTPDERAILYETLTRDIWSCSLGCEEPDTVTSAHTICPMEQNCDRLTSFPEPEDRRAIPTYLDSSENLYWLGEQGVWRTALQVGGASELVLETRARSFTTNGTWMAWVDLDGNAYLAHRDERTSFRLATGLAAPRYEVPNVAWTDAEVDVMKIEGDWIWWWDGESIRAFDLERRARLEATWTTELPLRPLGFALGACASYTLFGVDPENGTDAHVLVRPLADPE